MNIFHSAETVTSLYRPLGLSAMIRGLFLLIFIYSLNKYPPSLHCSFLNSTGLIRYCPPYKAINKINMPPEEDRTARIRKECDNILEIPMWVNLNEAFFWPIVDLMDTGNEDFVIHLYNHSSDKYLELLCHDAILNNITESLQSERLVECIRKIKIQKPDIIDDIMVYDMQSCLFINYEEVNNIKKAQDFQMIYQSLKNHVKKQKYSSKQLDKTISDDIRHMIQFILEHILEHNHEYFSYVKIYWLKAYFYEMRKKAPHIENHKKVLSELFIYENSKQKIDLLLSGKILLKEIKSPHEDYRTWIDVSLLDNLKPSYPFRTEPYAMLSLSNFSKRYELSKAKFKLRTASFLCSDIENQFDPNYDNVGNYIIINSLEELEAYLVSFNLNINDFTDTSYDDDYPL
ncbi:hypothetical protein [Xenorhabdus szentirmaii]|uniref:hypothetical protein n=1 Tax=Xenorhabdus szentirmaii TaxID=290112 RepID=UPI002B40EBC8|nr:hypothetical protein [Xenorhabdus sp. M]